MLHFGREIRGGVLTEVVLHTHPFEVLTEEKSPIHPYMWLMPVDSSRNFQQVMRQLGR